jgi:hypothetical protein
VLQEAGGELAIERRDVRGGDALIEEPEPGAFDAPGVGERPLTRKVTLRLVLLSSTALFSGSAMAGMYSNP